MDEARDNAPTEAGQGEETAKYWLDAISRYESDFQEYETRVGKIWNVYIDKRSSSSKARKMALLWANISLWQPAIYGRLPEPNVSRRFSDHDPVARVACEMLERCLHVTSDESDLNNVMMKVRDDFLIGARGTAWARYEAEFEPIPADELMGHNGGPPLDDEELLEGEEAPAPERIKAEHVRYDYVHWRDFGHTQARYWGEVTAVWRKTYLTLTELKKRFGPELAAKVGLDHKRDDGGKFVAEHARKATVYEIWDKATRKVYFIAKACPVPLEVVDPYLDLASFWPCPMPAYGTLGTDCLIPTPDYLYYRDQLEEIDALTQRIGKLTEQLKLVGFYPKGDDSSGSAQIERALRPGTENTMIGIPGWAAFSEKGGVQQIQWLPVKEVVQVLQACIELRTELKNNLHEVTGLSDIMRGDTSAQETAEAQGIKNKWGVTRLKDRQKIIAEFIKSLMRIGAEIIADRFQPETLLAMSNLKLPSEADLAPPPPPMPFPGAPALPGGLGPVGAPPGPPMLPPGAGAAPGAMPPGMM